jgi:hypothetical protein
MIDLGWSELLFKWTKGLGKSGAGDGRGMPVELL